MIIDVYSGANGSHPDLWFEKIYLCGQWRSSIRDGPGHARLGQNPPHRCRAASPRGAGSWPRRHGVTQGAWFKRIVGRFQRKSLRKSELGGYLVVGDGMIYSFLRGQSLLNPHCWMFFWCFLGGSSWINCSALELFRHGWMKYLN